MRGVYAAHINISGMTTGKTAILLEAPATACLEILSASLTNATVDSNEQMEVELAAVNTKGSPAGTGISPGPMEPGDQASAGAFLGDLSAEPTSYEDPVDAQGVSNLAGYHFDPVPEERPVVAPSGLIGLRLLTTIASADMVAVIRFRQIG